MKAFEVTTTIAAPREAVWALLTDADTWTAWNPTIDKIEGSIVPGETVTVHAKLSPGRAFPVTVSAFEPEAKMVWSSSMPLGLFKGERTYTLTSTDGGTQFHMREAFTGLLSPLIGMTIPDMSDAFEDFAAGLKEAAENP